MISSFARSLIRLSLFALVTVLLAGLLVRTIQGYQDDNAPTYQAIFTNATDLKPGDDVRLAGVTVGKVKSVSLTADTNARVRFSVDPSVRPTADTTVVIRYRDLIGNRYLALSIPTADGTPLTPGDTLPVAQTRPALDLTAVFNGFKPLFAGLDPSAINTLSFSLVQALQGEGGTIASLLDATGSLGQTIARHDATIGTMVRDLTTVLTTLNQRSQPLNRLITHLRTFSTGLARGRTQIVDALASIDDLASATTTLLARARPHLRGTIDGLSAAAHRLRQNKDVLEQKMNILPVKLNAIMRAAQYGSWFQFYNCGLGLQVYLNGDSPPLVSLPPKGPQTGICGA